MSSLRKNHDKTKNLAFNRLIPNLELAWVYVNMTARSFFTEEALNAKIYFVYIEAGKARLWGKRTAVPGR